MGEQRPRCATAYMDLELLNPFAADYPEHVESSHEFGDAKAVCARFNGGGIFAGQYIAVGREQGRVSIFDFETKESIRFLHGHTRTVSTVCWSQSSRYLLTAAADWLVNVWDLSVRPSDLLSDSRKRCIRFDAEVTSAQLHPRNSKLFVATLNQQREPELVDFRLKDAREEQYRFQLEMPSGFDEQGEPVYGRSADRMSDDEDDEDESREMATICRFNPTGDLIFAGTSEGNIVVWDTVTREPLSYQQVCAPSEILSIEFDPSGTSIVVNAKDRCLRVLRLSEGGDDDNEQSDAVLSSPSRPRRRRIEDPRKLRMDEEHRFQDLVNRTPWKGANFSRDGEYIVGGADNNGSHNIYIWDRTAGSLIKILEGPKDPLSDLHWHPTRPVIASVSQLGALMPPALRSSRRTASTPRRRTSLTLRMSRRPDSAKRRCRTRTSTSRRSSWGDSRRLRHRSHRARAATSDDDWTGSRTRLTATGPTRPSSRETWRKTTRTTSSTSPWTSLGPSVASLTSRLYCSIRLYMALMYECIHPHPL